MSLTLANPTEETSTVELAVSLVVRFVLGTPLSIALAVVGHFLGWSLLGPTTSLTVSLIVLAAFTGIGAGLGGLVGWVKLDEDRVVMVNAVTLSLALLGGLIGSSLGLLYAEQTVVTGLAVDTPEVSAVLLAAMLANAFPLVLVVIRAVLLRRS